MSKSVFGDNEQRRAAGNIFKFLALLLIMTVIARGTNGMTLARVDITSPSRNSIISAITGTATVSSRKTIDVNVPAELTIIEMMTGAGLSVKNGDALAIFNEDEVIDRLERESINLEKMILDLEKLERLDITDASSLETAERNYQRAQEDYQRTSAAEANLVATALSELVDAIDKAPDDPDASALGTALRNLRRAQDDFGYAAEQGESEIEAAQAALDKVRNSQPGYIEYSAVESAGRSLTRAQQDYSTTMAQGEAEVEAAQKVLDAAKKNLTGSADSSALESAARNLGRAQDDFDTVKAQGESEIEAAQAALDAIMTDTEIVTGTDNEADSVADTETGTETGTETETETETETGTENNGGDSEGDKDSLTAAQTAAQAALDAAKSKAADNLLTVQRRLEDAESAYRKAESDYLTSMQASTETKKAELDRAQLALENAQSKADENLLSASRRIEDAAAALEKAEQDYERAKQQTEETQQSELERAQVALENAKSKAEENLLSAKRRLEDAETALDKAENDFDSSVKKFSDSRLDEVKKARAALENAQTKAEENILSARRRVEDAEKALQKAQQDYTISARQTDDSAAQNSLSAIALRLDIREQESIVNTLKELVKNDYIVFADRDGLVSSAMQEGSVTNKTPLISFRDEAKGFEAHMQIKESDADKLTIGDECEVTAGGGSMYYTPTVTGTITGISQPDDDDMVSVTIGLPGGDWTEGQRIDAQVVLSSGSYDLCVPLSAVRSDNTGYFLLTVEQQNSVLGLQNIVTRVDVNILASDTDNASVRGPVDRNSRVITGSNKAVTAGDRVRVSV